LFIEVFKNDKMPIENIIETVEQKWLDGKGKEHGRERIPPLLGDTIEDLKNIDLDSPEHCWIKTFLIGIDALHNIKGFLKALIKRIIKLPQFDKNIFFGLLNSKIQRKELSDLDGAHFRYLFVLYETVIAPALVKIQPTTKKELLSLLNIWVEIQWLLYLPPEA
jgi:hypothetical protein